MASKRQQYQVRVTGTVFGLPATVKTFMDRVRALVEELESDPRCIVKIETSLTAAKERKTVEPRLLGKVLSEEEAKTGLALEYADEPQTD